MTNEFKPHVTVASIVQHHDRFLMVEESVNGKRVINQPAGHVEAGESLTAACVRETLEETGFLVEPLAVSGIYLYKAHENLTFLRICFYARIWEDKKTRLEQDIKPGWYDYEMIKNAPNLRSPMVLTCIDDFLSGNLFDLSIIKPPIGYKL